jgi:hypothetical protein
LENVEPSPSAVLCPAKILLEALPQRYRLIFPELLLELFLAAPPGIRLSPGDYLMVRLDKVSPREDQIKVSLA